MKIKNIWNHHQVCFKRICSIRRPWEAQGQTAHRNCVDALGTVGRRSITHNRAPFPAPVATRFAHCLSVQFHMRFFVSSWSFKSKKWSYTSRKLTACHWKMVVGRLLSFLGWPIWKGYVNFRECKIIAILFEVKKVGMIHTYTKFYSSPLKSYLLKRKGVQVFQPFLNGKLLSHLGCFMVIRFCSDIPRGQWLILEDFLLRNNICFLKNALKFFTKRGEWRWSDSCTFWMVFLPAENPKKHFRWT